ncbi:MAG: hypothetical protein JWP97_6642 [Labilithrix sp.]|nr:hypothetical protein [Labilithrix sp.]
MNTPHFRWFLLASAGTLLALAACTLAPDHCIAMSDCDDGTTCKEGLCVSNNDDDITQTVSDAGAGPATPPDSGTTTSSLAAEASADAGDVDAADGASVDAMTDAPSDG